MRRGLPWLGGLVMVACASKSSEPSGESGPGETAAALSWPVEAVGPYGTGYRHWTHTYSPSPDLPDRTIRMNLWYPTEDTDGESGSYTVGGDTRVIADGSLAPSAHGGTYPVHVYSHGNQGYGATSAFLSRYFASHGWVTIAPDHTDNTWIDDIDPHPTSLYFHRPLDIREALDSLAELPSTDPLAGLAATDAVLLSGHSFGGYTTWASFGATFDTAQIAERCADETGLGEVGCTDAELAMFDGDLADLRVVASIPMAGTYRDEWFGSTGYTTVGGPVLFMSGSDDPVGQEDQWAALTEIDLTWIELDGGCHQTFALGGCSEMEMDEGFHIVQSYALASGRAAVLSDTDTTVVGILDGTIQVSDSVEFHRRTD